MSKHMKRLTTPTHVPVSRKEKVWITRPSSGPHPVNKSAALVIILRDMLKYCDTAREARRIIGQRKVFIDGKPATDYKRPVGLMDVISIPDTKDNFRFLIDGNGKFRLVRISDSEAKWKLARIENKTTIKNGQTQLNLHDGRNLLVKKDDYKTGTVLRLGIPEQKILESYELKAGNISYLIGGSHIGQLCEIESYEKTRNPKSNLVKLKDGFSTVKPYVFVVGREKPSISVPEKVIIDTEKAEETKSKPAEKEEVV